MATLDGQWGKFSSQSMGGPATGHSTRGSSSLGRMSGSRSDGLMQVAARLNGSTMSSGGKSNNFTSNLHGRFYENNTMEGSKLKKRQKKLDELRKQKKRAQMDAKREKQKIEWMENRLAMQEERRRKKAEEEMKLELGAARLQGLQRRKKAIRRVNEMRFQASQMEKVALYFQSSFRGRLGRDRFDDKRGERDNLLVAKIQAIIRGKINFTKIARQQVFMIQRRNELASRIQKRHRGNAGRQRFREAVDRRIFLSAARMQAMVRALRGRKLASIQKQFVEEKREIARRKALEEKLQAEAATKIQSITRRKQAGKRVSIARDFRIARSVLKMQSVLRGKLGRERARRRKELLEEEERELEEARLEALREQEEEERKARLKKEKEEMAAKLKEMEEKAKEKEKERKREELRKLVEAEEEEEERQEQERLKKLSKRKEGIKKEEKNDADFEEDDAAEEGLDDLEDGDFEEDDGVEKLDDLDDDDKDDISLLSDDGEDEDFEDGDEGGKEDAGDLLEIEIPPESVRADENVNTEDCFDTDVKESVNDIF